MFAATGGLVGGGHATVGRGHYSMPLQGAATREGDGRRVQSEKVGGWLRKSWRSSAAVSAAERVEIANDHERLQRQRRMRSKALQQQQQHPPSPDHSPLQAPPFPPSAPLPPSSLAPRFSQLPRPGDPLSKPPPHPLAPPPPHAPAAAPDATPCSSPPLLSSEQLQRIDHHRHINRLLQSRKPRPQSAVKGYGEHQEWLVEVEARRKAARANLAGPVNLKSGNRAEGGTGGAKARQKLPPPISPHTGLYAECMDLAEGCRACISVLPGVA